jgi:hypothetical protein
MAVLDYPTPASAPVEHAQIVETGIELMSWFPAWINSRTESPGPLDVVLYSRNRRRLEAFLGEGLPRRPSHHGGPWHACHYHGRNLTWIEYPCGRYPWGEGLFTGDSGFDARDGTRDDSPQGRKGYSNRTLRALLRGETQSGDLARIRVTSVRPIPPARPVRGDALIDREFWSQVDLPMLRQALGREYFGSVTNQAVQNLLAVLELMQENARQIQQPRDFHDSVAGRWRHASTLLLWGEGGTGKSYLGKVLAELVYGHQGFLLKCQESGGGGRRDPIVFRSRFFGAPPGYQDADQLTDAGRHLVETQGFTTLVFDEVNMIAPEDFGSSMRVLYGVVHDRSYSPQNPHLTQNRPISLWNSIFVLTANLGQFPPTGLEAQDREAVTRRVSAYELKMLADAEVPAFAQWFLPRAVETALGGIAICTCDDLSGALAHLPFTSRSPDKLRQELAPVVDAAHASLRLAGITRVRCPLVLDITEHLRKALTQRAP